MSAPGKPSAARAAHLAVPNPRCCVCVGAGLPANTVVAAPVIGRWRLASRAGPFAGEPAPTTACAEPAMLCRTPDACVGAGLPANTVVAAPVIGRWRLASRAGPFAGEPAPTTACAEPAMLCRTPDACVGAGLPANTVVAAPVIGRWRLASRTGPFAGEPAPTTACAEPAMLCRTPDACVGAGLPANTVVAATVIGRWGLASRTGPFAGEPAPTTACAEPPMLCRTPDVVCVGAGLPANTVVAVTVIGGWRLASRAGPFAGEPAPTAACVQPPMRVQCERACSRCA